MHACPLGFFAVRLLSRQNSVSEVPPRYRALQEVARFDVRSRPAQTPELCLPQAIPCRQAPGPFREERRLVYGSISPQPMRRTKQGGRIGLFLLFPRMDACVKRVDPAARHWKPRPIARRLSGQVFKEGTLQGSNALHSVQKPACRWPRALCMRSNLATVSHPTLTLCNDSNTAEVHPPKLCVDEPK